MIFTRAPLLLSDKCLQSQSCRLLVQLECKVLGRVRRKARIIVPAALLHARTPSQTPLLLMSSRCVLSHQACQSVTFRRCLLLDSIAKRPEPEGKTNIPSLISGLFQPRCLQIFPNNNNNSNKTHPFLIVNETFFASLNSADKHNERKHKFTHGP